MASKDTVEDHLGQIIKYDDLTIWEDEFNRIIIPYAPFRTMGTRIIPKPHINYLGNATEDYLRSLAKALTISDFLMNAAMPKNRTPQPDRTIPFRQASVVGQDFHMFIDLYPPFPILAAESAEFLGLSPFHPHQIVQRMRAVDISDIETLTL
jgi:galactose-1-phosphate uridylyltransferase